MIKGIATPVPLVIVEEHHEAFYVWNYAAAKGWIPLASNTLLHVDAHADLWLPRLRRSLPSPADLTNLARFVYSELDICNFIWPAAYMGTFNRVLWLKHEHRQSSGGWREIIIARKAAGRREFLLTPPNTASHSARDTDEKIIQYAPVTPGERVATDQAVILDIDLDYFCCNDYPDLPFRSLEVTRATFNDFTTNPYHFLRLSPGDKISAAIREGKYYLDYNDYHPGLPDPSRSRDDSHQRLDNFVTCLQSNSVKPALIVICRSCFSGYTPGEFVAELQDAVLGGLSQLYAIQQFSIADILPMEFHSAESRSSEIDAMWPELTGEVHR